MFHARFPWHLALRYRSNQIERFPSTVPRRRSCWDYTIVSLLTTQAGGKRQESTGTLIKAWRTVPKMVLFHCPLILWQIWTRFFFSAKQSTLGSKWEHANGPAVVEYFSQAFTTFLLARTLHETILTLVEVGDLEFKVATGALALSPERSPGLYWSIDYIGVNARFFS